MRRARGFTIAELLISCVILGLLLTTCFMIYRMGAAAWMKSDAKTELLQIAQVATAKVNREVEGSCFESASAAPDGSGVAFLNAKDLDGVFVYDPVTVLPRWQKYVVLYFDPASLTLFRKDISVLGGTQESAPLPIDSLGQGPVQNHFNQGRLVAKGMQECKFSLTVDEQLVMEMSASKLRYGSSTPEKQTIRVVTAFRN
jgi:hypothetical protein